jgi:hypothetical protein
MRYRAELERVKRSQVRKPEEEEKRSQVRKPQEEEAHGTYFFQILDDDGKVQCFTGSAAEIERL